MKILRISLCNLASLEGTQTVDFTREPLLSAGLFAISGPTGSGKSTLLDALCLALYDQTPRLAAAGTARLPDAGGDLAQRDPRNLLRRGAGEGFAEVAFLGVDGLPYTARWTSRRARGASAGAFQQTEMVLLKGNHPPGTHGEVVQGGRKTEVLDVIAGKVGLSYAQFTRAVLLAQNDFAVFLKADDKERATLLQTLTGTERFESLSKQIYLRNRAEEEAVNALVTELSGRAPLPSEARAAVEHDLATTTATLAGADAALAARGAHAAWFHRFHELTTALATATGTLASARHRLAEAEPRRRHLERVIQAALEARPLVEALRREKAQHLAAVAARTSAGGRNTAAATAVEALRVALATAQLALERARQTSETAAPDLTRARTLDTLLEPSAARLAATELERRQAERLVSDAHTRHESLQQAIARRRADRQALAAERDKLALYAALLPDAHAWTERLGHAHQARQTMASAATGLAAKRAALAALKTTEQGRTAVVQTRQAERTRTADALAAATTAAKAFDHDALATGRRRLDAARDTLLALRTELDVVTTTARTVATLQRDLAAGTAALVRDTALLEELQTTRLPAAAAAWQTSRDLLAIAEAAVADQAARLRGLLQPDQPCPVCGARAHPFSTHAPVEDAALSAIRLATTQKLQAFDHLRQEVTRLETTGAHSRREIAARRAALTENEQHLAEARRRLALLPDGTAWLEQPDDDRSAHLQKLEADQLAARQQLEAQEHASLLATKALETARQHDETARTALAAAEHALNAAKTDLAATQAAVEAAVEHETRAQQALAATLAALAPLFAALPHAEAEFTPHALAFIDRFKHATATLRDLDERLAAADQQAAHAAVQLAAIAAEHVTATDLLKRRQAEEAEVREEHTRRQAERQALLGGQPTAVAERALQTALGEATAGCDRAKSALGDAEKSSATAAEALRNHDHALTAATTRLAEARDKFAAWLARAADGAGQPLTEPLLHELLQRDEAWIKAERAALDQLAGEVKTAEGGLQVHTQTLAAHTAARPTADPEETVLADLAQRRTAREEAARRQVDAAAAVNADDRRRAESAAVLQRLEAQRARAEPWARLNDLLGSSDGAKFRAIAQQRTLDLLLAFANTQLELLSARYRLERLPGTLNLIVLDRDMGEERRSVHSLSGGESFLVSLGLALGLASLSSNRLRIESLFIDEGFGSLDAATLNVAMGALTRLEAQGRRVGVISHVSEMAEAIPVQICVVKGRSGSSRLLVPGAPAADAARALRPDRDAAPPTAKPPGASPAGAPVVNITPAHVAQLRAQLESLGGKAGNQSLRHALAWDEPTYEAVKDGLVASGELKSGRGRGGSVSLAERPPAPPPAP